jgi:hypothetical protein
MPVNFRRFLPIVLVVAGCSAQAPQPPIAKAPAPIERPVRRQPEPKSSPPSAIAVNQAADIRTADEQPRPSQTPLASLLQAAAATEFDLPQLDEEKITAAGIRKLAGQHIVIYTDLPADNGVDELPHVFDVAVPLWCAYFGIEPKKITDWNLIGSVIKDKERFAVAGLYPESLPDFRTGFNVGSQIWLYEQPSAYYRRHLLLHEGTHAFMLRWLGGAGPPWYMEGMAELLGTHRWGSGELTLGVMPAHRDEVPHWGRIKIVKQERVAGRGMSLIDIMQYGPHAHLEVEAYAWCWSVAAFLDQHPLTQLAFRELKTDTRDRTIEFSKRFYQRVKSDWPAIVEDWQMFVADCDYGYDFSRAATVRKEAVDLPAAGATVSLAVDRAWQSTGFRLAAGKRYQLSASGRYQVAGGAKPWPCEAGGITIHYAGGRPLGMLLAGVTDLEGEPPAITPLANPQPIGAAGELAPMATGTLYLKINEAASGLADNTGMLSVKIREK